MNSAGQLRSAANSRTRIFIAKSYHPPSAVGKRGEAIHADLGGVSYFFPSIDDLLTIFLNNSSKL